MKRLYTLFAGLLLTANVMAQETPKGLSMGAKAPLFTGKDQDGKQVSLQNMLKKGSVVLFFYRGEWCPYCNRQLSQMEDSLSMITGKGATVVAVTPEKPENIDKTISKTKATYTILHDDKLKVMKEYDVAYAVNIDLDSKLKGYGVDLGIANGSNGSNLPVPAVYIIDKSGKITYRYFNTDYTKRPSVAEILKHL
jgi:peroxiredoxin